jgi:hypothetical protein
MMIQISQLYPIKDSIYWYRLDPIPKILPIVVSAYLFEKLQFNLTRTFISSHVQIIEFGYSIVHLILLK